MPVQYGPDKVFLTGAEGSVSEVTMERREEVGHVMAVSMMAHGGRSV